MGFRESTLFISAVLATGCFADPDMMAAGDTDDTTAGVTAADTVDPSDGSASASGGSTSGTAGTSVSSGSASTQGDSGESDSDDSDGGSTGGEPSCGDGVVEGDELCEPSDGDPSCTEDCVPQGTRVWLTALDDVLDDEGDRSQDLLVAGDGSITAVAHQEAFALDTQVVVRGLDSDGTIVSSVPLPGAGHDLLALASIGTRRYVLAHDGFDPWLAELETDAIGWRLDWTEAESYLAFDVAADTENLYVFALDAVMGEGLVPTLRGISSDGEELFSTDFVGNYNEPLLAIGPDGPVVQYGLGDAETSTLRAVCQVTPTGSTLGCWNFDLDGEVRDMLVADDGTIYVAGLVTRDMMMSWAVAAFSSDGTELWSKNLFEGVQAGDYHYASDLALTPSGHLVVGGSVRVRASQIEGGWALLDPADGSVVNTWTDDEAGPVRKVAVSPDGTLVSLGSMNPTVFPKAVFVTKQRL